MSLSGYNGYAVCDTMTQILLWDTKLQNLKPALFGLDKSNRDFSRKTAWGKNQFNSSFPASLCAYLNYKGLSANYLTVSKGIFTNMPITINQLFNTNFTVAITDSNGYCDGGFYY